MTYKVPVQYGIAALLLSACRTSAADLDAPWIHRLRFIQLEQVSRFNYMDRGPGIVTDRDGQYRVRTRVQFDLAEGGRTYLRLRAETGRGFDNSWDNSGIGKGQGAFNFNVKSFAIGRKIGSRVELQAGGIEFDPGAGTQHSYASTDGHLIGYRMIASGEPGDKLSFTMGYVGDFAQPNVFRRLHMGRVNYMQALGQKKFGARTDASAELDSIQGVWFLREALRQRDMFGGWLDEGVLEIVTRTNQHARFAWTTMLTKSIDRRKRVKSYAIYADMPRELYRKQGQPILMNRGEIESGKRIALGTGFLLRPELELGFFGGRLVDRTPSKRWIAQVYVSYQYANLVNAWLHR